MKLFLAVISLAVVLALMCGCISSAERPTVAVTADGYRVRDMDDYTKGWEIGYNGGREDVIRVFANSVQPMDRKTYNSEFKDTPYEYDSAVQSCLGPEMGMYSSIGFSDPRHKNEIPCLAILKGAESDSSLPVETQEAARAKMARISDCIDMLNYIGEQSPARCEV